MNCQPIKAKLRLHKIGFDVAKTMATRKYKFQKYSFFGALHDETEEECL